MARTASDPEPQGTSAVELQLSERVRGGDEQAWEALVELYFPDLWRLAYFTITDEQAASDIVQETLLKARAGIGSFRGDCPLRSWVRTICRNLCRDELRRRARRGEDLSLDGPVLATMDHRGHHAVVEVYASPGDLADEVVRRHDLERALLQLPEDEREAIGMTRILGYTAEEVAELQKVPASTVRSRVARGKQRLVDLLRDYECEAM